MILASLGEMALVLVYVCALVIKTCDVSAAACRPYGLGDDSKGEACQPELPSTNG